MGTVASGQAKWEAKMQNAGSAWKAGLSGAEARWAAGLSAAGAPPGPISSSNYSSGIARVSAAEFQASVAGKGSKWAENFRRGIGR
jgi:hypothetical protein